MVIAPIGGHRFPRWRLLAAWWRTWTRTVTPNWSSRSKAGQPHGKPPAYVYWGSPDGYSPEWRTELPTFEATGVQAGDLDGDGSKDLVFVHAADTTHGIPGLHLLGRTQGAIRAVSPAMAAHRQRILFQRRHQPGRPCGSPVSWRLRGEPGSDHLLGIGFRVLRVQSDRSSDRQQLFFPARRLQPGRLPGRRLHPVAPGYRGHQPLLGRPGGILQRQPLHLPDRQHSGAHHRRPQS